MFEHVHFENFLSNLYHRNSTVFVNMFEHVHFYKILILKSAGYVKSLKEECQLASYSQKIVTKHTKVQRKYN